MTQQVTVLIDALAARVGYSLNTIVHLIPALEKVRSDLDITVLVNPRSAQAVSAAVQSEVRVVSVAGLGARLAYEQLVIPLRHKKGAVVYCPFNFCPVLMPSGVPVVLHLQNAHYVGTNALSKTGRNLRKRAEVLLAKASIRRADRVVTVSKYMKQLLESEGRSTEKVEVIYQGDPQWPEEDRRPQAMDASADFFLSLANDYPHKRLDDLVQAWVIAVNPLDQPPLLVLAGAIDDGRRRQLRKLVPPDYRASLVYLGSIADRAVIKWLLQHARALVVSSELEALPTTPREAASLGCPAIVTDIPPHREVLDDHRLFVEVGNVDQMAEMMWGTRVRSSHKPTSMGITWEESADQLGEVFHSVGKKKRT